MIEDEDPARKLARVRMRGISRSGLAPARDQRLAERPLASFEA